MKNIQNLTIDINKKPFQTITANVGEVASRFIRITILDNNVPADLTGVTAYLYAKKADGTKVFNSVKVEDSKNGIVLAELTGQVLAIPGLVKLTLLLTKDGAKLASKQIIVTVDESAIDEEAIQSTNEFNALTDALTKVTNISKKMDRGESILVSQIDKNKGKIDQTYLSEELISQIAGNASINTIPADNSITNNKLAPNSLTFGKFEGFRIDERFNLWDKNNLNTKGYYNEQGSWVNNSTYGSTGFIPIDYTKTYKQNFGGHITFWDSDFNFICKGVHNNGILTIPSDDRIVYFNSATQVNSSSNKYIVLLEHETNKDYAKFSSPNLLIKDNNLDKEDLKLGVNNVDFITISRTINLFDKDNCATGYYLDCNTGNITYNTSYCATNFMPVDYTKEYIGSTDGHISYYDENKRYLFGHSDGRTTRINNDSRVKYCVMTYKVSSIDTWMCVEGDILPNIYIPYYRYTLDEKISLPSKTQSELNGLTWNVMGDSISSTNYANGRPYWYHLAKENNMQVRNYAISGAWISKGGNQTISEAWETMEDEADIITVFAGTNDNLRTNPLGTMEDRTNTTFYGALHVLYSGLVNKYPGKKLGIITIMLRNGYRAGDGSDWDKKNNAILEVAKYYNLPVFKAHEEFNLNANIPLIKEKFIEDGLHPNEEGQKIMARRLKKWLESL